jgi:AcrR family transcriptional regulator
VDRDAEATKRRLLDAATEEFARYGIAGGRVDRIAAQARANKAQIYHYFGSKDGLFDAVFSDMVAQTLDEVPIDAADLPAYAGRLHDSYRRRPWVQRLATWYRLERGDTDGQDLLEAVVRSNANKIEAIRRAQEAGTISSRFSPAELLALVVQLSSLWSVQLPESSAWSKDLTADRQRRVIEEAVAALIR